MTDAEEWPRVAKQLYTALLQMKRRRGIHIEDADLVLDAIDAYQDMTKVSRRFKQEDLTK